MTKEYAGGIDFTSFIDKDGFQHSLTARKETSAEAYADLQATIALAIAEGGTPFVRDYNKAGPKEEGLATEQDHQDALVSVAQELGAVPKGAKQISNDELADIYRETTGQSARIQPMDKIFDWAAAKKDKFFVDSEGFLYKLQTPPVSGEFAEELGGVEKGRLNSAEAMGLVPEGLLGREIPDGHTYLGLKPQKLEDIRENDSYQVLAETYSYDGTWVNFYNGAGEMSVAGSYYANPTGVKIFDGMFHWQPQLVDKAQLPGGNVLLYILGVRAKNNNIYQNIKQVEPA